MKKSKYSDTQIVAILKEAEAGQPLFAVAMQGQRKSFIQES